MKFFIFLFIYLTCAIFSFGQNSLNEIALKYKEGNYPEVIKLGKQYRKTLQGKGIPALDYMILTSVCMDPKKKTKACGASRLILSDYYQGLSEKNLDIMRGGFNLICNSNKQPDYATINKLSNLQFVHSRKTAGIYTEFKSFYNHNSVFFDLLELKKIHPSNVKKIAETQNIDDVVGNINNDEIDKLIKQRCSTTNNISLKRAIGKFGVKSKHSLTKHFLVIAAEGSTINTKKVAINMEKVLEFYNKTYSFKSSDEVIVINLPTLPQNVKAFYKKEYGISINTNILGYSNKFNNSITAWIPHSDGVGTIKHELVHLLLKSKFDNIPHWFEEGLAELYEESTFEDTVLVGRGNWRFSFVKSNLFKYSLIDLIDHQGRERYEEGKQFMQEKAIEDLIEFKETDKAAVNSNAFRHLFRGLDKVDLHDILERLEYSQPEITRLFFDNYFYLYEDALSKYFILYLQNSGRLKALYNNLAERDENLFEMDNYETTDAIVARSCDKNNIAAVEDSFMAWLEKQTPQNNANY